MRNWIRQLKADRAEKRAFERFWMFRQTALYWNRIHAGKEART